MATANLFFGAQGAEVKRLQQLLGKAGYKVKVDGDYKRATEKAVEEFQKSTGGKVKVDGVAGPATIKLLRAAAKSGGKDGASGKDGGKDADKGGSAKLKMTVPDYSKFGADLKEGEEAVKNVVAAMQELEASMQALKQIHAECRKLQARYTKAANGNRGLIVDFHKHAMKIEGLQQEFRAVNGKDRAKAEALLKEIEDLHGDLLEPKKFFLGIKNLNRMQDKVFTINAAVRQLVQSVKG